MKILLNLLLILAHEASNTRGDVHKSVQQGIFVFKTFTDEGNYGDAEKFCNNDGGWIAEPTNTELNDALAGILGSTRRYWIGLRFDGLEWKWERNESVVGIMDGSTCSDSCTCTDGYCNWMKGDGDNSGEDYAAIQHGGKWTDINNVTKRLFACQYGTLQQSADVGNYVFKTFTGYGNYEHAKKFCTIDDGWISEPTNESLNTALTKILVSKEVYWIGLTYNGSDWKWEQDGTVVGTKDESTCPDVSKTCSCTNGYCNWNHGDGDNKGEDFAAIKKIDGIGKWLDIANEPPRQFSCQYGCLDNRCEHGGTCTVSTDSPYYNCDCTNAFEGDNCQTCIVETCQNGGTCVPSETGPNYYTCDCTAAYYGTNCECDFCESDTCLNGGTCNPAETTANHYNCTCTNAYYGTNCEHDYCESNTCLNGGTCRPSENTANRYDCTCTNAYYGTNCEHDYCKSNTCLNGGTCRPSENTANLYNCTCTNAYYGTNCEHNYCESNTCLNGGTCSPSENTANRYNCTCTNAYYGTNCEHNYCESDPCKNAGTCSPSEITENHYNCVCADGYYGTNCENFVNITSTAPEVIAVEGCLFYINATVEIIGYKVTVALYFEHKKIDEMTNVGSGTITFALDNITESSEGNYTFCASPPQENYTSTSSTNMTVHVEARIKLVSTEFIFSPITTGPDNVTCEVYGKPPPVYGWYVEDQEVTTTNHSSGVYQTFDNNTNVVILYVANANLSDDGTYACRAKNEVGEEGRNVTCTNTTVLAVYGPPTIESTAVTPCTDNGEITINWRPNSQTEAVAHNMTILKGKIIVNSQILSYSVDATIAVLDLEPNTVYNTTITVCPDECISFLNDAEEKRTGDGTPGEVASAKVTSEEITACIASWEKPKSPNGEITGYVVEWTSSYVYEPSGDVQQPGVLKKKLGADDFRNEIEAQPNRLYNATVYAKTCAGDGEKVDAVGSCTTPPASPDNATAPDLADKSGGRTSILPISIPGIDETNGQVSCVYVVVQKGNNLGGKIFTPKDLVTLQQNAENGEKSSYLALAIPGNEVGPSGLDTMLGDDLKTNCNAISADQADGRKRRDIDENDYQGINVPLDYNGAKYLFLTLIATPVGDTFVLIQSPPTPFTQGESLVWVTGVVLAVVVLITIPVIIYMRRNQDRMKNDNSIPMDQPNGSSAGVDHDDQLYENVQKDEKIDRKITLKMLENIYRTMKSNESMQFREEYNELRKEAVKNAPPCNFGKSEAMMKRNRYKNIIPYDSTRVVLQGEGVNSYINACYVKGPQKKFIATQGPLPHTVNDFWRMVVEQRCRIIVMLTRCQEAGKRKCEQYWPNPMQAVQHGQYNIRNGQEKHFGGYVRRELKIYTANNEEHHVYQYQFLRWPDHGVPKTTSAFFRLHKEVMQNHETMKIDVPILVHCSAGVGRTGAFIGFDILQAESKKRKFIDIYNCVLEMRKQRVDMVQTCEQYELLHKLLLEIYLFGETDVRETDLQKRKKRDEGGYRKEFQNLTKAESLIPLVASDNAGYTPGAGNRVVIMRQPEDTEWITIDATFLEAYHHGTRLIAACGPSKSTVEYFWRAILDNDIDAVVMLNSVEQQNENTEDVKYWPDSRDGEMNLNNLSVRMVTENDIRGITHRTLVVSRPVRQQQKEIMHFQLLGWRQQSSPGDGTGVLDLLNDLHDPERRPATILVHSSKGIGRAGTFCALFNLLERLKNENMLDVFRAVKDLRELRPGVVESVDQYTFCYDVAMTHLSSRNVYANEAMDAGPADPIYENL